MKNIFLIIIIFLCTACTVDYDIYISKDDIEEKLNVSIDKNENNYGENVNQLNVGVYSALESIDNKDNLLIKRVDSDSRYVVHYYNKYNHNKYGQSLLLKECYENVDVNFYNEYLNINTSNYFECIDYYDNLSGINISISTDYKVSGNYDKKMNNKYIWIIDKSNYTNKPINLNIKLNNKNEKNTSIIYYIVVTIFLCYVLFIYNKVKKSNK